MDIAENSVSVVPIKGTKKSVRLRWLKPYTIERITQIWIERDLAAAQLEKGADVLKDLAKELDKKKESNDNKDAKTMKSKLEMMRKIREKAIVPSKDL